MCKSLIPLYNYQMPTSLQTRKIIANFSNVDNVHKQVRWTREELEEAVAETPQNDYNSPPLTRIRHRIEALKNEEVRKERCDEIIDERSHDFKQKAFWFILGLITMWLGNYFLN